VAAVVNANQAFAFELFDIVASETPEDNVVLGPHSVSTALTVSLAGARGNTATEMASALQHTLADEELHVAVAALDESLRSRDTGTTELAIANRVWLQDDLPVVADFERIVGEVYDAGPERRDLRSEWQKARQEINQWAADATNDRIPEIIGPLETDRVRWAMVNANYLDAEWANRFEEAETRDAPFTLLDGTTTSAMTMNGSFAFTTNRGRGWAAARLPYRDGELSMVLVVPNDLAAFRSRLDAELWSTIMGGLGEPAEDAAENQISLPRFSARTHRGLIPALETMGVKDAFTCEADFLGIFDVQPMADGDTNIGLVEHEAFVAVDEAGTEAAAVTAVVGFQKVSGNLPDEPFVVDRPFMFAAVDDLTGAVLFMGQITDPAVAAPEPAAEAPEPRLCG
jgi:serpin B